MKTWLIHLYGFESHTVQAPTRGAARYADWRRAKEAGYFTGRDGFWRYLIDSRIEEVRT